MKGDIAGAQASFGQAWTAMQSTTEISGTAIAGATGKHSAAAAALMKQNLATMPPETARIANQSLQGLVGGLGPMPGAGGRIANDTTNQVGAGLRRGEPVARSAGVSMAAGLASAIAGGRSGVISAAITIATAAWYAAKAALGIRSPSRLFMQLGDQVVAGFVLGMRSGRPEVEATMTTLARAAAARFDQTLTAGLAGASGTVADSLRSKRRRGPGPGMVQAEDGSWVHGASYYADPVTKPSQARLDWLAAQKQPGAGGAQTLTLDQLATVLNAAQLRVKGSDLLLVVDEAAVRAGRR